MRLLREAWVGSIINLSLFRPCRPGPLKVFRRLVGGGSSGFTLAWHTLSGLVWFFLAPISKTLGMIYLFHLSGFLRCLSLLSKRSDKTNAFECKFLRVSSIRSSVVILNGNGEQGNPFSPLILPYLEATATAWLTFQ